MSLSKADAEKNLNEFVASHGTDGFVELFLTNYLFELVMYYLQTERSVAKESTGYRFYVDGRDRVYPAESIEAFKGELRHQCRKKATAIVGVIKNKGLIDRLGQEIVLDREVAQLLVNAFEEIVGQRG